MENFIFSLYEGGIKQVVPTSSVTLYQLFNRIVTDTSLKKAVDVLRTLPEDSDAQKTAKSLLPYVTPSGMFKTRGNKHLERYSGLICIDIDHVEAEKLDELKEKLKGDEGVNVLLLFVSPRGEGLKVFLPTDGDPDHHKDWFLIYSNYFLEKYGLEVDRSCKDVSRACYLSYDEGAWIGELRELPELPEVDGETQCFENFEYTEGKKNEKPSQTHFPHTVQARLDVKKRETVPNALPAHGTSALSVEEMKANAQRLLYRLWDVRRWKLHVCDDYPSYFEFVSACASSTGEYGRETCREICKHSLKYEEEPFDKLYSEQVDNPENTHTYGTVVFYVDGAKGSQNLAREKPLVDEDWTWEHRPKWIPYGDTRNMEICYIMGFLTSASAVMPHVYFYHDNQKYYLNLYTIIQGELASGKSKATLMTKCVDPIDQYVRVNSDEKLPYCVKETGNITDAMLIFDLAYNQNNVNNGSMLIHVAEIDVMSQKKKIGLSSENTRLAWGHECISSKRKGVDAQSRKEDRKGYRIEEPRVSILMTGTPSQLPNYFTNNTDGNLSRYLIYTLDECKEYRSGLYPPTSTTEADYSDFLEMWREQREKGYTTELIYTEEQKKQLDEVFNDLKQFYASQNDKFHNYINRMPIAVRRIAGIIATLDVWSSGQCTARELTPTEEQWTLAIQLVLNSLPQLYKLYSHPLISHQDEVKRQTWVNMLNRVPTKFSTQEFLKVAMEEGYAQRGAEKGIQYLRLNNYIKQPRRGWYEKVTEK